MRCVRNNLPFHLLLFHNYTLFAFTMLLPVSLITNFSSVFSLLCLYVSGVGCRQIQNENIQNMTYIRNLFVLFIRIISYFFQHFFVHLVVLILISWFFLILWHFCIAIKPNWITYICGNSIRYTAHITVVNYYKFPSRWC